MKTLKSLYFLYFAIVLLAGCSNDNLDQWDQETLIVNSTFNGTFEKVGQPVKDNNSGQIFTLWQSSNNQIIKC